MQEPMLRAGETFPHDSAISKDEAQPTWVDQNQVVMVARNAAAVTARKDDAPATHQAAFIRIAGWGSFSDGGGLIHTTSG